MGSMQTVLTRKAELPTKGGPAFLWKGGQNEVTLIIWVSFSFGPDL